MILSKKFSAIDEAFPPLGRVPNPLLSSNQVLVIGADRYFLGTMDELVKELTSWRLNLGHGISSAQPSIAGEANELYAYQTSEFTALLPLSTLIDLVLRKLSPSTFLALREKFGVFYEISDYFYDPETGFAIRPINFAMDDLARSITSA